MDVLSNNLIFQFNFFDNDQILESDFNGDAEMSTQLRVVLVLLCTFNQKSLVKLQNKVRMNLQVD